MLKPLVFLALIIALVGCASKSVDQESPPNLAAQKVHDDVIQELLARQDRQPTNAAAVGTRLSDLNRVRPGKFEVYVFPKISNRANKEATLPEEMLGPPRAFEVSLVADSPCSTYGQKNLFAQLRPLEMFPAAVTQLSNRRCSIVEVTAKDVARMNRALLKRDDQLQIRLFMDEDYVLYGYDMTLVDEARGTRVVRVKNDTNEPASSGLTLFPIDFPNAAMQAAAAANPAQYVLQRLDAVAQQQIRRRYNRAFQVPSCSGLISKSVDYYGQQVLIGWCRGVPWPHFIENSRFISITQPLSVR